MRHLAHLALCLLCLSARPAGADVVCQLQLRIDTSSGLATPPAADIEYEVVNATRLPGGDLLVDLDYFIEAESDLIEAAAELLLGASFSSLFGSGTVTVESGSACAVCDCDGGGNAALLRSLNGSMFGVAALAVAAVVALIARKYSANKKVSPAAPLRPSPPARPPAPPPTAPAAPATLSLPVDTLALTAANAPPRSRSDRRR